MVEDVHPLNYVLQIFFFVWAAVLAGICARALHLEILLNGYQLTPRATWCGMLCLSSLLFVCLEIDPLGALGIYPPQVLKFFEWMETALLLDAFSCALYLYLIVLYQQHLEHVPPTLSKIWIGFNAISTFLIMLTSVIGSATNNLFWFGITTLVAIIHEALILILINLSLSKISAVLKKISSKISTDESFRQAIRKMRFIRLLCFVTLSFAIGNQTVGGESFIPKLVWNSPLPAYRTAEFVPAIWIPPTLVGVAHMMLLYTLRRPDNKESATLERIDVSTSNLSVPNANSQTN